MQNIKCSGFGGQGVLTQGLILSFVAMDSGDEVSWIPSYGSEMRGGLATCTVRISEKRIGSPFITEIDILIAMNLNSITLWQEKVKPGGIMVVNASLIPEGFTYRDDITVVEIPGNDLAIKAANPQGLNVLMLASAVAATGLFDKKTFSDSVDKYFAKKGRGNPQNAVCIDYGWSAALENMKGGVA